MRKGFIEVRGEGTLEEGVWRWINNTKTFF